MMTVVQVHRDGTREPLARNLDRTWVQDRRLAVHGEGEMLSDAFCFATVERLPVRAFAIGDLSGACKAIWIKIDLG